MKVKICGLTREQDVRNAAQAGADFLGFVLAPSPRQVSVKQMRELCRWAAKAIPVAVLVNPSPAEVDAALAAGAGLIQLHGRESVEFCDRWPGRIIKALSLSQAADLEQAQDYQGHCAFLLLDSGTPGSGQAFDWRWITPLETPFFLAGGMDAARLERAALKPRPFGVDASSALETAPGQKDPDRVRALIQAARRYP